MFPNHSKPRAFHHYDTTGNMVTKTLAKKIRPDQRIEQHSNTSIVDLIVEDDFGYSTIWIDKELD